MRPATARRLEPRGKSQESDSRFYDARHTFVTRLAENPRSQRRQFGNLLDTVSSKMPGRYAHIRAQARREAISTLESSAAGPISRKSETDGAQNWAHSSEPEDAPIN